jgi:hypothetical protein
MASIFFIAFPSPQVHRNRAENRYRFAGPVPSTAHQRNPTGSMVWYEGTVGLADCLIFGAYKLSKVTTF